MGVVAALAATGASGQINNAGAADVGSTTRVLATAMAHRASGAFVIDGRDLEPGWTEAVAIDAFRQFDPEPDAPPSLRTEFKTAYDGDNLYVFVRAYDPHPDSIMRALTRRDVRGPSDQISLIIDSYNDRRTGYNFHVNPDGVKRDQAIYNDGQRDSSWDAVWDVATTVDELGWTAEFQIPLSQLRYTQGDEHVFGFGVWRDIERYNETVSWPLYSRTTNGLVSQMGQLSGLRGLTSERPLELTPYLVTQNVTQPTANGFARNQEISVGGDIKLGLTSNVTLDATVNPDFGQVEADPAVLNLTAFETFQRERRPFFVEGTGVYEFALNCYIVVDCSTNEGLFYSRRIGRDPSLRGRFGDETTPTSTPIAAAAKLTGRTESGLSFGVLDAYTRTVHGVGDRVAEPSSNYAVLSAQQDLRDGETSINAIGTAVNRAMDASSSPYLHESAYVGGLSFRNRFAGSRYELAGSVAASRVAGTAEAITRTQRSPVHYYQQPGDDVQVDSTLTSMSGYAAQVKFGKYGGGITRFETSLVRQSSGFEVNDLGFLRRADIQDGSTWASLSFQSPTKAYRWARLNANHWQRWTTSGLRLDNAWNFNGHMGLHNNWDLHAGATFGALTESYCDRCTRGGPPVRESRGIFPWFGVNSDARRTVSTGMWVNLSYADEGNSRSTSLNPYVNLRFSTRMRVSLGAGIRRADDNTQWIGNFSDGDGSTHYAFAHLDQRTVSTNVRINYTHSPTLTFEFYGEPFTSSGEYTDFREVSDTPGAAAYADRYQPYIPPEGTASGFSFTQLRTNAVVRWEYSPGSALFLVWAHGRQDFAQDRARQPWTRDFGDLFDLHPDNTFLVKVAYWFNR